MSPKKDGSIPKIINNSKEIDIVDDNEEEIIKAVTNGPLISETNGTVNDESIEITEEIKVEGKRDFEISDLLDFSYFDGDLS